MASPQDTENIDLIQHRRGAAAQALQQPSSEGSHSANDLTIMDDAQSSIPRQNEVNVRTFTVFPSLPLELRRMIWFRALPGPRIFDVAVRHPDEEHRTTTLQDMHTPLVGINQACRESREVVLMNYDEIPTGAWSLFTFGSPSTFLFNYDRDIVYLSNFSADEFLSQPLHNSLLRITTIGFDTYTLWNMIARLNSGFGADELLNLSLLLQLRKIILRDSDWLINIITIAPSTTSASTSTPTAFSHITRQPSTSHCERVLKMFKRTIQEKMELEHLRDVEVWFVQATTPTPTTQ